MQEVKPPLRYGDKLCQGRKSPSGKPAPPCVLCERRLAKPGHAWQKYIEPAPAQYVDGAWSCDQRVEVC